jgi:16S rRNA (uracil1498-N3)-methyltransferase
VVERRRQAAVTTFHAEGALAPGATVALPEAAAHHARVKRMSVGDAVQLTDGRGTMAAGRIARIARAALDVEVGATRAVPPASPLELYAPVGDRDRMLWLAEKAAEFGVTAWRPVVFARSRSVSPRGEGEAFGARVRARMISALEQSGGAWLPALHAEVDVTSAARAGADTARYLLDASGGPFDASAAAGGASVILGPEGGLEDAERAALVAAGWQPVALAANILRFETAGVAAIAVIRAAHLPGPADG